MTSSARVYLWGQRALFAALLAVVSRLFVLLLLGLCLGVLQLAADQHGCHNAGAHHGNANRHIQRQFAAGLGGLFLALHLLRVGMGVASAWAAVGSFRVAFVVGCGMAAAGR